MKQYVITFRSITYAQRGERLLRAEGLRCSLRRTPRWMEEQGCGYSLRFRTDRPEQAAQMLNRAGIPWRKLYLQRESGDLEEVAV